MIIIKTITKTQEFNRLRLGFTSLELKREEMDMRFDGCGGWAVEVAHNS